MTARNTEYRLRSRFCEMVASGLFLLVVLLVWPTAEGVASAIESSQISVERRGQWAAELPGGMDPMDVAAVVRKNMEQARGETFVSATLRQADQVGSAFHIGGEAVCGQAALSQYCSAVAFDGTNYFVVWRDHRTGSTYNIYGARVSITQEVIDSAGIAISIATGDQGCPDVAFDGTNYLVVWRDYRTGGTYDIYGARVSVEGIVLDSAGVAISIAAGDQSCPAVASDGTNCLVVWSDERNPGSSDVYGTRVSKTGEVLDPGGIAVSTASGDQGCPDIAFDGFNYFIIWEDFRSGSSWDIYFTGVSPEGVVLDTAGRAVSTAANDQTSCALVFNGSDYLAVWSDLRNGSSSDIYGARLHVWGTVLDPAGIAICTAAEDQYYPAVAFDGANCLVTWHDQRPYYWGIYGARVSIGGTVLDVAGIPISEDAGKEAGQLDIPSVVFGASTYLVVWTDYDHESESDIYGAPVSTTGLVLGHAQPISKSADNNEASAVAFNGTNYLVVWNDLRAGSWSIYGARVSVEGVLLDPIGITISTTPVKGASPSVAFDGANYLVVWDDGRTGGGPDIYGARVTPSGAVLDPQGIQISRSPEEREWEPSVAFGGTIYLVVWTDYRAGTGFTDVYGARVTRAGLVLDSEDIPISSEVEEQQMAQVAYDGANFFVVWGDTRNYASWDIYGARVSTLGVVLDPHGIAISTAGSNQWFPRIATDGTNCLVVWSDWRNGRSDIYGARVSAGVVLDPDGIVVSSAAQTPAYPDIAAGFDGTNYLIAWEDARDGSDYDIFAARVSLSGEVLDPTGLALSTATYDQFQPAIARGSGCSALVTYRSFTPSPYWCYRIWGNIWSGPTGLTFASASVQADNGCVSLSWEMAVDVTASSFRMERSESVDGPFESLVLAMAHGSGSSFSCMDCSVLSGKTYWYRIVLAGVSSEESYGPIEARVEAVPTAYQAYQSYPNPFNPLCTIRYGIPRPGRVSLQVYDIVGKPVSTLVNAWREPGVYSEIWDGRDEVGRELPSGVYFYRLKAGDFVATRKMVLLK